MIPSYWTEAKEFLTQNDPVIARLIALYPDISLESRNDPFYTLARSIVGQQISVKAADSVWRKLSITVEIIPASLLESGSETLRQCGLSSKKVEYLQDLSRRFVEGGLNPEKWSGKSDEELIRELCLVKGIGRWTAEMFLIFHMLRPNVFPIDDIGLQRAIRLNYYKLQKNEMMEIAEKWQPWRSVATWYLWRSLDPVPVEY